MRFDAWRRDPVHQRALDAMHELWGELSALKALQAAPGARVRIKPAFVAAAAAALVLALGASAVLLTVAPQAEAHIRTQVGEQQTRTLPDGSVVAVNVATSLDYATKAKVRAVRLQQGEATFFVRKDAARSFVVQAGVYRVRAVGTTFDVRYRDGLVDVAVAQGVVEIHGDNTPAVLRLAAGQRVQLSGADASAPADELARAPVKPAEAEHFAEWRLRTLNYQDVPVSTVVEDFNDFYARPIQVENPALARRRVTIRLQVDEREETLQTLAGLLQVKVRAGDRADTLLPAAPAEAVPG